ncbi:PREDICTED: uncharacterized protein LOC108975546 [Bactrocera latifrons]|uniref:Uncharacterized protein n=1 Tax=Bactrocera latifrons TaxID=174628 RepID=A0A0K8WHQ4_BACLA|nr:PREDICTED: uncharacterized protein LOC108975546 [Bactrocera latifrons]
MTNFMPKGNVQTSGKFSSLQLGCGMKEIAYQIKERKIPFHSFKEIKDVEATFPFIKDEIIRCFMNIMIMYKRIKKRNHTSGESATNCEYFEALDEVFFSQSCVQLPEDMTESSIENLLNTLTGESAISSVTETPSINLTPTLGIKRKKNDVIDFLIKEFEKDEATIQKLLKTGKDKVSIEREKLEEVKQIRLLFESMAEKLNIYLGYQQGYSE